MIYDLEPSLKLPQEFADLILFWEFTVPQGAVMDTQCPCHHNQLPQRWIKCSVVSILRNNTSSWVAVFFLEPSALGVSNLTCQGRFKAKFSIGWAQIRM